MNSQPFIEVSSTEHPGIPLAKLARQDEPILFYDDVTLFEDELHDNGVANLSVKIVRTVLSFVVSPFDIIGTEQPLRYSR